jgi:hypothetical protein
MLHSVSKSTGKRTRSRVLSVEKPAAEESSGQRFLEWLIRHPGWTCGRGLQPVDLTDGYCWSTPKYRNWRAQHAFFEGKKAEQTSPRKSTPRTLKEVGQQYPSVFCARSHTWLCPRVGASQAAEGHFDRAASEQHQHVRVRRAPEGHISLAVTGRLTTAPSRLSTISWQRLRLRFERIQQRHSGRKLLGYTMIHLRAFCGI